MKICQCHLVRVLELQMIIIRIVGTLPLLSGSVKFSPSRSQCHQLYAAHFKSLVQLKEHDELEYGIDIYGRNSRVCFL